MIVPDHRIEDDEELASGCDEDGLGCFACGSHPLAQGDGSRDAARGRESRDVRSIPDLPPLAPDASCSLPCPAFARIGSEAGKGSQTWPIEDAKFGEFAEQGREDRWADTGHGRQPLRQCRQGLTFGDDGGDLLVQFADPTVRMAIMLSISRSNSGCPALWRRSFSALRASTNNLRRLRKSAIRFLSGSCGVVGMSGRHWPIWARTRVDLVCFRQNAERSRGLACLAWIDADIGDVAFVERLHEETVASAGRFEDDESSGVECAEPFRDGELGILDPQRRPPGIDADVDEGVGEIAANDDLWHGKAPVHVVRARGRPKQLFRLKTQAEGTLAPKRGGAQGGDGLPSATPQCYITNRQGDGCSLALHWLEDRCGSGAQEPIRLCVDLIGSCGC